MALELRTTTAFERVCGVSRNKGLDEIEMIVNLLQAREPLPARCRPHPLRGDWVGHWDCHVARAWILLYKLTDGS